MTPEQIKQLQDVIARLDQIEARRRDNDAAEAARKAKQQQTPAPEPRKLSAKERMAESWRAPHANQDVEALIGGARSVEHQVREQIREAVASLPVTPEESLESKVERARSAIQRRVGAAEEL